MAKTFQRNKLYTKAVYQRRLNRDSIEGSTAIKLANEIYLPIPSGFLVDDTSSSYSSSSGSARLENGQDYSRGNMPWYHANSVYSAYLQRARYPEIVGIALSGLVGTAVKKRPVLELPPQINYMEEDAGDEGESIYEIFAQCIMETLIGGNVYPIVNVDPISHEFFIQVMECETLVDWDETTEANGFAFANFERKIKKRDMETFETETIQKNVLYYFNADRKVVARIFEGDVEGPEVPLSKQGQEFDHVPIFPIGARVNCAKPQTSPLNGLAEIALSIYQMNADLRNAQYLTCNPSLVMTGVDTDIDPQTGEPVGKPHLVGSTVALLIDNPDAKVYYTQTDTAALENVKGTIGDLFVEAALYSVSIVGSEKKAAESEGTTKMRQGAKNATLITVVENCGKAIKDALKFIARLSGADEDKVKFEANTDFAEKYISPELMSALVQAWIARGLSLETLLRNFKDAGILMKDEDITVEMARIASAPPQV